MTNSIDPGTTKTICWANVYSFIDTQILRLFI